MKLNIDALVNLIVESNVDVTTNFSKWTKVAFAIAGEYGEEGRAYFHKLARLSPTYKKGENDKKYDNALKTGRKINISSLIYLAKENNIDVSLAYTPDIETIDENYQWIPSANTINAKITSGMNMEWVENSISFATESNLYKGMINLSFLSKKEIVGQIFNEYKVGAFKDGITSLFWQIDKNDVVRNGKTIPYKEDMHRDKSKGANWVHSLKKMDDYIYKQCPFGEFLSSKDQYKNAQLVFLVESEKTALICNLIFRNNENSLWMAVGGVQNLNKGVLNNLQDKYIKLFADKDAVSQWMAKRDTLERNGFNVQMIDWQSFFPGVDIGAKDDIADIIIKSDRQTLIHLRNKLSEISCF